MHQLFLSLLCLLPAYYSIDLFYLPPLLHLSFSLHMLVCLRLLNLRPHPGLIHPHAVGVGLSLATTRF